jgi:hypothetical protein
LPTDNCQISSLARDFYLKVMRNDQNEPVKPEKEIPAKPDTNPDPTKPKPGGNEPEKNDPTRIMEPPRTDPTRIDNPPLPKPGQPGTPRTIGIP